MGRSSLITRVRETAKSLDGRKTYQTLPRTENTITYRDDSDHRIFEQSTSNIWSCLSKCCKSVLAKSGVPPESIKGVSFDATCSLAVVDKEGTPISVTKGEGLGQEGDRNVILWADHRAEREAEEINKTGEGVLNFVGGVMSVSPGYGCIAV